MSQVQACQISKPTDDIYAEMLGVAIEPTYFDLQHQEVIAADVVHRVKQMGANTIRLGMFSHQGHAYYHSQIAPKAPYLNRDLLADFQDACREQGIRLAVYINSKWVTDLYHDHPDWIIKFKHGPMRHDSEGATLPIYPMCPCSPFMDYFCEIVKEIVTRDAADLIYIDNFGIEPFCKCPYCRDQFGEEIPDGESWDAPQTIRYLQWFVHAYRRIAQRIVDTAKSQNPQLPVVFNYGQFWSTTTRYSPEDNRILAHEIADGVHAESAVRFYGADFEHINEQCTLGRSIGLPIWTWVEYPVLPFSYVAPSSAELKVKAAKVIANGGRPMLWSLPIAPTISSRGDKGLRQVYEFATQNMDRLKGCRVEKMLAIACSTGSVHCYSRGDASRLARYRQEFSGAHYLALRNHMPYDFILDDQITAKNLSQYVALVLPNTVYLTEQQCDAVRHYVQQGGGLFATYETTLYDAQGHRRQDFALADVFGATYKSSLGTQFEGYSAGYCRFASDAPICPPDSDALIFPIGGNYLAVESHHAAAKLLARCRYYCDYPQPETKHPAIIARQYGQGRVVYLPGEFFAFYRCKGLLDHSHLFRQCIVWMAGGQLPVQANLPDTVELTMMTCRNGDRLIHLVNCTYDKTRPIQQTIAVEAGYQLRFRSHGSAAEVTDLTTGLGVSAKHETGYLCLTLPRLVDYTVILVKRLFHNQRELATDTHR